MGRTAVSNWDTKGRAGDGGLRGETGAGVGMVRNASSSLSRRRRRLVPRQDLPQSRRRKVGDAVLDVSSLLERVGGAPSCFRSSSRSSSWTRRNEGRSAGWPVPLGPRCRQSCRPQAQRRSRNARRRSGFSGGAPTREHRAWRRARPAEEAHSVLEREMERPEPELAAVAEKERQRTEAPATAGLCCAVKGGAGS